MLVNTHTYHSLRYGILSPEELVAAAKKNGMEYLALTDINAMTGIYDFVVEARKVGIKPIAGIEFRNGDELLYIGLAKNLIGFRELNEFLSLYLLNKTPHAERAPQFNHVYVIYPLRKYPGKLRDNEFVGIAIDEVHRLHLKKYEGILNKCVMLHPVTIATRFDFNLHLALRAIDHNIIIDKLQKIQHCELTDHMPTIDKLLKKYETFPSIAATTLQLLDSCSFNYDFKTPKNKKHYTESVYGDKLLLSSLAMEGMERRYGKDNAEAKARVEKELTIIENLGFAAYFLITWDIVHYSLSRGFFHVGRGSGANSVVAYCIGISDVDPIELDLYFERFLNPHRLSPPDFDIDWSHDIRNHILDYIFEKFGRNYVGFVGNISTFRRRSPIRELGKVFGLPKQELDALTSTSKNRHQMNEFVQKIHQYSAALEGKPNLRSMHSCGILVTEEPIYQYTAMTMLPKGYPTAQIDMYICEDIGLEKLDILSQRGLGSINSTIKLIEKNKNKKVNIQEVQQFKNDPRINERLSAGKTIGCFYIESPAMRGLLRRLKCNNYNTLVAASSVIRPGVAQSGMMSEYIMRHNNGGTTKYLHPLFEKYLSGTYGIMVYQEDVIKIAHYFAGLDLGEADILRRAMSGKARSKSESEKVKLRYFENCKKFGYSEELTNEVYRQIESFAGYSFCKAHSASYSVESYQSLYLKTYFPLEFIVGVINNFGGFYRTEVYVHEAKMSGGTVHLPCVNKSEFETTLYGDDIYLGFVHIERLEDYFKKIIADEREKNGAYISLEDFITRTEIKYEQLKQLIYVGAFRFTGKTKAEQIVQARMFLGANPPTKESTLFPAPPPKEFKLPAITRSSLEDAFDEIDVLGFPVSLSTFNLLDIETKESVFVSDLPNLHGKFIALVGMLIAIKDVPTARGHMNFGTWIDSKGDYFDTVHFAQVLQNFPFMGGGCYALYGKVVVDFHMPTIEIREMKKLPMKTDPRYDDPTQKTAFRKTHELSGTPLTRNPYPSKEQVNQLFGRA
ncbi:MAG: DNA polymerase III subunit alpha [Bacteroidetes bacterium]|nr:DNA polymerase III subunit alpha [Bacteroidota bacterium]